MDLANNLDAEQRRATGEGLSEDELALFDLLKKPDLTKIDRERVKQAEVEVFILDHLFKVLPSPPFSDDDKQAVAKRVYQHVWQQSVDPQGPLAA